VDIPLSGYFVSPPTAVTLGLNAGAPEQPTMPIMPLYVPTGPDTGLLYAIDATYLADALAHGVHYEADQVVLVVANARALNARGDVMSADTAAGLKGTRAMSPRWAFSVVVVASPHFVAQAHLKFTLLAAALAMLLNLLIAAVYLIVFAPRRLLLNAVRRGLKAGEMYVVYQPVVEIATRRIEGVEALIRWTHPKWGVVNPGVFMEEVERSSLLANVTRFMLDRATEEIAQRTGMRPLRLAVNIAPMDLQRKNFVVDVLAVNERLPDDITLVLEVTERFLLEKHPRTEVVFNILKSHGVKFAIDDFGTHHSNLDLLGRFPFDYVKIDGQFVRQIDRKGCELIRGIAAVSKHYGMEVIAEGVETESQHEALRGLGIPFGQGYFYERPVPVSALFAKARQKRWHVVR
jgi:EAL domain-containing protein (putative c-di-GMP-specific phosphodiesterase class I)